MCTGYYSSTGIQKKSPSPIGYWITVIAGPTDVQLVGLGVLIAELAEKAVSVIGVKSVIIPESTLQTVTGMAADVQLRLPSAHRLEHQDTIIIDDTANSRLSQDLSALPSDNMENRQPQPNASTVDADSTCELSQTSMSAFADSSNNTDISVCTKPLPIASTTTSNSSSIMTSGTSAFSSLPSSAQGKVKYGELVLLG